MSTERIAEILRDVKTLFSQYNEVFAEVKDDGSITFLGHILYTGDEYLFGTTPENLEIDYVHWKRGKNGK